MLQLLLNCLIVVACSGVVLAQDVQTISVQDLRDGKVILMGRLGVPVGTPVEVKYEIVEEQTDKELKSRNRKWDDPRARVNSVNGNVLEPFVEFVNVFNHNKMSVLTHGDSKSTAYEAFSLSGYPNVDLKPERAVQVFRFEAYSDLCLLEQHLTENDRTIAQAKNVVAVSLSSVMNGKILIIGDLGVPIGTVASVTGTLADVKKESYDEFPKFRIEQINGTKTELLTMNANPVYLSAKKQIEGYRGTFLGFECIWIGYDSQSKRCLFETSIELVREKEVAAE